MTIKEQVIKDTHRRISQYQQSLELLNKLPDGPFDFLVDIGIREDTIYIDIPFDLASLRKYRKAMGKGWQCDQWSITNHDSYISKCICYYPAGRSRYDGSTILLSLNTNMNGSTCKAIKIGVEEKPIFKIVCE